MYLPSCHALSFSALQKEIHLVVKLDTRAGDPYQSWKNRPLSM
jgi:hypothetical protein